MTISSCVWPILKAMPMDPNMMDVSLISTGAGDGLPWSVGNGSSTGNQVLLPR